MGLLDDAIREHLDLKRRRGADPNEVDRLEREALGPVRRGAQVTDEALPEEEALTRGARRPSRTRASSRRASRARRGYDDQAGEEPWRHSTSLAAEPAFAAEPEHEPFPEDAPSRAGPTRRPRVAEDQTEEPLGAEEQDGSRRQAGRARSRRPESGGAPPAARPTPPPAPPEPRSGHPGGETVEYDVEAEEIKDGEETGGEESKGGEEDPLEETPEFLQDTPDHDRLWFEQRPPKDFDFDK